MAWRSLPACELLSWVGREVRVALLPERPGAAAATVCGTLFTVDPESRNVFLLLRWDELKPTAWQVVFAHAIASVECVELPEPPSHRSDLVRRSGDAAELLRRLPQPSPSSTAAGATAAASEAESLLRRRAELEAALAKMRVPYTLADDGSTLVVLHTVEIRAPYSSCSCYSTNEIVLRRVQAIVRSCATAAS